jgi:hypothetical protein
MMRPTFVVRLKVVGVALGLGMAALQAADPQQPSMMGATRDQLIARYGEPKSQIVAGNRVVLFFARDKFVLRDGVVIEVERLPDAAARAPTPPSQAQPAGAAAESTAAPSTGERATKVDAASAGLPPGSAPSVAMPQPGQLPAPTEVKTAPPEPKFQIKSVRAPGAPEPQPVTKPEAASPSATAQTPVGPAAPTPSASPGAQPAPTTENPGGTTRAPEVAPTTMPAPGGATPAAGTVASVTPTTTPEEPKAEEPEVKAEQEKKVKAKRPVRRRVASEPDIPDTEEILVTKGNWFIVFAVTAIGVGYILWRNHQRRLALVATSVSRTPFNVPVQVKSGVVFNTDLLQKLEWRRFEELVASYYAKTGVVAVRTKSGPAAPVHIKISWKGEPRPFAYVQCIAQPAGLIDVKPLQELVNVLTAEDIRRGYVVSSGKFSVSARDLAEEKHITLLPGDIFVEKLNALPDSARSELMQETTAGDYTTPSCPKCEAKMVRAPENPALWRCPTHMDVELPVREGGTAA